jgi:hypothetical protein
MKWRHRPDVEQLQDLMETYCGWEPRVTRQKLLPLLVEWDMRAAARALRKENESAVTPERRWELLAPKGVEFIVERIAKESGNNKAPPWRYLLEVNSADPAHWAQWQRQVQRVANELGGAGVGLGDEYLGRALPPHFHERGDDLAFLKAQAQRRSVRMSLVRKTCPHLVARFEAGGSNGASKSAPVTPAKAKSKSAANTPRGRTPKSVRGRPPPRSRRSARHNLLLLQPQATSGGPDRCRGCRAGVPAARRPDTRVGGEDADTAHPGIEEEAVVFGEIGGPGRIARLSLGRQSISRRVSTRTRRR